MQSLARLASKERRKWKVIFFTAGWISRRHVVAWLEADRAWRLFWEIRRDGLGRHIERVELYRGRKRVL